VANFLGGRADRSGAEVLLADHVDALVAAFADRTEQLLLKCTLGPSSPAAPTSAD
jgi:hypothetical protein